MLTYWHFHNWVEGNQLFLTGRRNHDIKSAYILEISW